MPLYEYKCRECGHRFERIQKFSDAPAKKCPECGGTVDQLISSPAVHFKGSGFYVTDYASKPAAEKSKDGTAASSDDSSAGKAVEKPGSEKSSDSQSSASSGKEEPKSKTASGGDKKGRSKR